MRPRYITATRWRCADHREVVRDEQIGEPSSSCRSCSRLTTCAWIETSSADTGSSQTISLRLERQRARDADALALAAGELVRIVRIWSARKPTRSNSSRRASAPAGCEPVDVERLADDVASRHARVERGERVLEHDLHLRGAAARSALDEMRDVLRRRTGSARGRLDQTQHAARDGRLAAAGLADQAERLARADRKRDAVHRVHLADLPAQEARRDGKCFLSSMTASSRLASCRPQHTSAARQQAARWPPPQSASGGYSASQRSIASGQRGAKGQPGGRSESAGTVPGIS